MIRSVAMQIWPECMKAPKLAALTASSRSASAITIIGALPPSSSRHFFRLRAALLGDDPADLRRAGEVDPPGAGMGDQRLDHLGGVAGIVGQVVDDSLGRAGVLDAANDLGVRPGAELGALQDHGVAVAERRRDRPRAEDHRGVPRRDADHDARGLAASKGHRAGDVGGDHLAGDRIGLGAGLTHHPAGELAVEHPPAEGAAGLLGDDRGDLLGPLLDQVGPSRTAVATVGAVPDGFAAALTQVGDAAGRSMRLDAPLDRSSRRRRGVA